jgi:hypothetical protein
MPRMATDDLAIDDEVPRAAKPTTRLFVVRLWKEELTGESEYRGAVRDVMTDAFRGFRDWSDLVAFMVARIEQANRGRGGRAEGGM